MLKIGDPVFDQDEKDMVIEVLESGIIASGSYVKNFEASFAEYVDAKYAIATSSGTTALHTAVESLQISEGSEIITTPFTFIASSNSILYSGLKPVFADIDPTSFNIDPESIKNVLKKRKNVKALLVVHLYGLPCKMKEIVQICKENDLFLIEDCAQANGATYNGQPVGTFGDVGIFSFYPTKNMTTGEGGMIVTNNDQIQKFCRRFINHGSLEPYYYDHVGYNYRMTNINGAIGQCQLKKLNMFNDKRIRNANKYIDLLGNSNWISMPVVSQGCKHVFNSFTLKINEPNRDDLAEYMKQRGIGYGIYYPVPLHKQNVYRDIIDEQIELSVVEEISNQVISIPVHASLSESETTYIAETVQSFAKERGME